MKQIFILCLAGLALISCNDKKNKQWDADAMVSIRPAAGVKAFSEEVNPNHLSALEIVKQATSIQFFYENDYWARGFADFQRDTVNLRLMMWGTDIIDASGNYHPAFIESQDMVLIVAPGGVTADTVGYIPNKVLQTAQPLIKQAYNAGDYDKVYELFDKAFTFTPITGAEWRELKARGEN